MQCALSFKLHVNVCRSLQLLEPMTTSNENLLKYEKLGLILKCSQLTGKRYWQLNFTNAYAKLGMLSFIIEG